MIISLWVLTPFIILYVFEINCYDVTVKNASDIIGKIAIPTASSSRQG